MGADGFTTVHVTTDPVEAEMLAEALRSEAIDARVAHVNSALLGAGPQLFDIRVDVADESVAQARAILEDLRHPGLVEELSAAHAAGADEAPGARNPRRAGVGLLFPGAGHFAAGLPWTALTLEVGVLYALGLLVWSRPADDFVADFAFASLLTIVAADVVGAWRVLRVRSGGAPAQTQLRQIARGVGLLSVAAAGGVLVAAIVGLPGWLRARDFARLVVACSDHDVTISNTSAHARYVSLDRAGVSTFEPARAWANPVDVDDTSIARLAAGEKVVRHLAPRTLDVDRCRGNAGGQDECVLFLHFTVQDIGTATTEPRAVSGRCVPDWSGAHRAGPAALSVKEEIP
jgi:hypothetical protein